MIDHTANTGSDSSKPQSVLARAAFFRFSSSRSIVVIDFSSQMVVSTYLYPAPELVRK